MVLWNFVDVFFAYFFGFRRFSVIIFAYRFERLRKANYIQWRSFMFILWTWYESEQFSNENPSSARRTPSVPCLPGTVGAPPPRHRGVCG